MQYKLLMALSKLVCLLPHGALLAIGKVLGHLYYCLISKQRELAIRQMMQSLGISRSEVASSIFINACNEFQFLESVKSTSRSARSRRSKNGMADEPADLSALGKVIESIITEQADEDGMFASELKGILLRLQPDFNEKAYGCATFGKLLSKLEQEEKVITVKSDNFNVVVSLNQDAPGRSAPQLTAANWKQVFQEQLNHYKDDGF